MNPRRWRQVREILDQAISREATERSAYLDQACAGDAELRGEVESLLGSHDAARDFLHALPANLIVQSLSSLPPSPQLGRRIGVYQIVEEIGRGGMGEVYRAVRVDGLYDKQVAIKLVCSGWSSALVLERFRHERQILASLEHPNIARLYDGGTTEDGLPYLVEEYIEGVPINQYCIEQRLELKLRLELFCQVCAAVQYAHQRLVIHRDIKPSNVLVTAQGVPKLLDFGIAKIIDPGVQVEATQAMALTPAFASPEQILGGPITTATDTYSLGVLLYHLLTGCSPYRTTTDSPHELTRLVCEANPRAPSTLAPRVQPRGLALRRSTDLDNIVLKALRKEPERRYASTEQFADDLQHYLQGAAVSATPDSASYRFRTFVRRHTVGVATSALVLLSVLAGVAMTWHEAHIAQLNARRAEDRFNDVHQLADSLIFELHDSIRDLPGATPARKLLVERALQYLERLARDVSDEVTLERDLAAAYQRVGDVQGNPFEANLGDTRGALRSYQTALELRERIHAQNRDNISDGVGLAQALRLHADALSMSGNIHTAVQDARRAVALLEPMARAHPRDPLILEELYRDYQDLAGMLGGNFNSANLGEWAEAVAANRNELATARQLSALDPTNQRYQSLELVAQITLGDELRLVGQVREAAAYYRNALGRFLSRPGGVTGRKDLERLHATYMRVQFVQLWDHDIRGALASNRAALAQSNRLSAEDPEDAHAPMLVASDYANLADSLSQLGRFPEARADAAKAVAMLESIVAADPKNTESRVTEGLALYIAGEVAWRAGDGASALSKFRAALAVFVAVGEADPSNSDAQLHVAAAQIKVADMLAGTDNGEEARRTYGDALKRTEANQGSVQSEEARYAIAGAALGLGSIEFRKASQRKVGAVAKRASQGAACAWRSRAAQAWAAIREPGALSPNGFYTTVPDTLRRYGWGCVPNMPTVRATALPQDRRRLRGNAAVQ